MGAEFRVGWGLGVGVEGSESKVRERAGKT